MKLCDYGCGQEAKHPFKNGKWCCSKNFRSCLSQREKLSKSMKGKNTAPLSKETKRKISEAHKGKILSEEHKRKISKAHKGISKTPHSKETKRKISEAHKGKTLSEETKRKTRFSIKQIKERYPFFSKIEEMRYNPDKPNEKEIQVHCKNHNCKNSKEKRGWFIPTKSQLFERINAIEKPKGFGESNFYCCQYCKDTCPLYGLQSDPYKENNLPYTYTEYQTCRTVVMERENDLCEYCGEPATDMHHIFPVKKEPFFALDPDYCIACCEKHHYKYAHKDECSTGNLAKIVCSVESQRFLNQKLK